MHACKTFLASGVPIFCEKVSHYIGTYTSNIYIIDDLYYGYVYSIDNLCIHFIFSAVTLSLSNGVI